MDPWCSYEVTHSTHELPNPTCLERMDELGQAIGLAPGARDARFMAG